MPDSIKNNFHFNKLENVYQGKVRDVYFFKNHLAIIVSDRISAFDHILPKLIPYKGQVLNQIAAHFLNATRHLVPNWLIESPLPNVSFGLRCEPIRLEMVVRGYLAGHAWREYDSGKRTICGIHLPEGLKQNDKLPFPIITPTTKAMEGHDEDISAEEILIREIVSEDVWKKICESSLQVFEYGTKMAEDRGLILVDTKYEFGFYNDEIYLMDEIHTPDSSRYFIADHYQKRQEEGLSQLQLSKEFVREWLINRGFQGKEGQEMPEMPDDFVHEISSKYIELYEIITGQKFIKTSVSGDQIENKINFLISKSGY